MKEKLERKIKFNGKGELFIDTRIIKIDGSEEIQKKGPLEYEQYVESLLNDKDRILKEIERKKLDVEDINIQIDNLEKIKEKNKNFFQKLKEFAIAE